MKPGQLVIVKGNGKQVATYIPAYIIRNDERVPYSSIGYAYALQTTERYDIIQLPLESICLFLNDDGSRSFLLYGDQIVEVHSTWIEAI